MRASPRGAGSVCRSSTFAFAALLLWSCLAMQNVFVKSTLAQSSCSQLAPALAICTSSAQCNGGACVRGVCSCGAGKIGPTCADNDRWLKLGSVAITQAGLDHSPHIYADTIREAYDQAKRDALQGAPPYTECESLDSGSYDLRVNRLTEANIVFSDLVMSTVSFTITSTGIHVRASGDYKFDNVRLDLWGGVNCCSWGHSVVTCPQVCRKNDSRDKMSFLFRATMDADISLSYSAALQGVQATVANVAVSFSADDLGAELVCPSSNGNLIAGYVKNYFTTLKETMSAVLLPSITAKLTEAITAKAKQYQGVREYEPYPGMWVVYRVVGVTLTAGVSVVTKVEGKVRYTFFNADSNRACHLNVTYSDTSADKDLEPTAAWPVKKHLSPSGLVAPLMSGGRMTRSFFNAAVWAYYQEETYRKEEFKYEAAGGLSADAKLTWGVPVFTIPNTAAVLRAGTSGTMSMSCSPTATGSVMDATYDNVRADFQLRFADLPEPSVTFQLLPQTFTVGSVASTSTQLQPPPSGAQLKGALEGALNFNLAPMNEFFLKNGRGIIVMPPDLQEIFPDATVVLVSLGQSGLPGATSDVSGFAEITAQCVCSFSDAQNQGADGFVRKCLPSLLNKVYCMPVSGRRRLREEASEPAVARRGLTPMEDLELVLGRTLQVCVTRSPTKQPTSGAPTLPPSPPTPATRAPTFPPTSKVAFVGCDTNSTGCYYDADIVVFACPVGFAEVPECRKRNDAMFCCPVVEGAGVEPLVTPGEVVGIVTGASLLVFTGIVVAAVLLRYGVKGTMGVLTGGVRERDYQPVPRANPQFPLPLPTQTFVDGKGQLVMMQQQPNARREPKQRGAAGAKVASDV